MSHLTRKSQTLSLISLILKKYANGHVNLKAMILELMSPIKNTANILSVLLLKNQTKNYWTPLIKRLIITSPKTIATRLDHICF
ncbi:hypothetical protein D6J04_12255 [Legionella taurinensis]|uniref:Uncharacterized protein n=1 Tax=Legionella taurinensis TaxID=70611 RepID=A0A3A5L1N4_9GAMM|nr:hypothetical protein D6J04_12255 [Legionella taurinensis]